MAAVLRVCGSHASRGRVIPRHAAKVLVLVLLVVLLGDGDGALVAARLVMRRLLLLVQPWRVATLKGMVSVNVRRGNHGVRQSGDAAGLGSTGPGKARSFARESQRVPTGAGCERPTTGS